MFFWNSLAFLHNLKVLYLTIKLTNVSLIPYYDTIMPFIKEVETCEPTDIKPVKVPSGPFVFILGAMMAEAQLMCIKKSCSDEWLPHLLWLHILSSLIFSAFVFLFFFFYLVLWYLNTCKSLTYSTSFPHNPHCPYYVISSVNTNLNIKTGTQGRSQ